MFVGTTNVTGVTAIPIDLKLPSLNTIMPNLRYIQQTLVVYKQCVDS